MNREEELTQFVRAKFIDQVKSLTEVYASILIHSTLKQHEDHIAEFMTSQFDQFMKCLPHMIDDAKKECEELQERIKENTSIAPKVISDEWSEKLTGRYNVQLDEVKQCDLCDPTCDDK